MKSHFNWKYPMKKRHASQLLLLFAFASLGLKPSPEAQPQTKRDKNIVWISKQINTYGQATGLFYLGKGGAHWSCHQIDVKSDSLQIIAKYKWHSADSISSHPENIRFEDISFVAPNEKPIPVIELSGKYGKRFTLVLDLLKHPDVKKQLVKAFGELIDQNKERELSRIPKAGK